MCASTPLLIYALPVMHVLRDCLLAWFSRGGYLLSESGQQQEKAHNYVPFTQLGGRRRMLLVPRYCPALKII